MTSANEYITEDRLWDALEDVNHWLANEGADVIPPVIKKKITTIMMATQRNDRVQLS